MKVIFFSTRFDFQELLVDQTGRFFENLSSSQLAITFFAVIFVCDGEMFQRSFFFTGSFPNRVPDCLQLGGGIQFAHLILSGIPFCLFDGFTGICLVEFEGD